MTKRQKDDDIVNQKNQKKLISPVVLFIIIALSIVIGFVAGTYKFQIVAAIGPVFGYKSHSGSLDVSSLQQTYNELASRFDGTLDNQLLIEGANRGMVAAAGDDYTVYMSTKEAKEFNDSLSGKIGGIGAEIGLKNNKITIIRALKDNPAEKAGLFANDIILSVNDQSTDGWAVDKTVSLIRGEEGTTVKLSVQRGSEIKEFTITRAILNNPSVESSVVGGIGILTITRFDDKTGELAKLAAQDFKKQSVKGIILDLRGNGGGIVAAAVDVASLWLNNKIVLTEKTNNIITNQLKSGSNPILAGLPTVVLVNGSTASAGEIVAGSLRDNNIAKLVGEKTFGKGSVQQPVDLDSGALLKVTIARWFTPNDVNLTKDNSLTPDSIIDLTQADIDKDADPQLNQAKSLLGL